MIQCPLTFMGKSTFIQNNCLGSCIFFFFFLRAASDSSLNPRENVTACLASFSPLITQQSSALLQVHCEEEKGLSLLGTHLDTDHR